MTVKVGPTTLAPGDGAQDESSQHANARSEPEKEQAEPAHPAAEIVVEFPRSESTPYRPPAQEQWGELAPEEQMRLIRARVEERARQPEVEALLYLESDAQYLHMEPGKLKELIKTQRQTNEKEKRKAEAEQQKQRKERAKNFKKIAKLPRREADKRLADMAERDGVDAEELYSEFTETIGGETSIAGSETWAVEPWPEPVPTDALLDAIFNKIRKHVAMRRQQVVAVSLWVVYDWIHDLTTYSTFLIPRSEEEDSGKTTLMLVLRYLVNKPFVTTEPTGPVIYRTIDAKQPTFIVDEAKTLLSRKSDVYAIINASWTRGIYIRRQNQDFDPYCPKIIGAAGKNNLPRDTLSRGVIIDMLPSKPGEVAEEFDNCDDAEFTELRRKLARWASDNGAAIMSAKPTFPLGFNNRLKKNWRPLLAIAEHAGEHWAKQARDAASFLLRGAYEPSWLVRLFAEMDAMFQKRLQTAVTAQDEAKIAIRSEAIVQRLLADPFSPWQEYTTGNGRRIGKVSEYQVAAILRPHHIYPRDVGPTSKRVKGYRWVDCRDKFARYRERFALVQDNREESAPERIIEIDGDGGVLPDEGQVRPTTKQPRRSTKKRAQPKRKRSRRSTKRRG